VAPVARKEKKSQEEQAAAEKQANMEAYFQRTYDQSDKARKAAADHFPEQVNWKRHIFLPRLALIRDHEFFLSPRALAVWPVIASRAEYRKNTWFHLSEQRIAALAGLSIPTAQKGIEELLGSGIRLWEAENRAVPILERRLEQVEQRRFYKYRVGFLRPGMKEAEDWEDGFFPFRVAVIDSQAWARLRPRAKALYWALRSEALFEWRLYQEIEGVHIGERQRRKFAERKWEVYRGSLSFLCDLAGISRFKIQANLQELVQEGLLERGEDHFRVHLWPHGGPGKQ
jgi:hypothetical protein